MNINLTLIGQAIWFILFVLFCAKFVFPPVIKALDERKRKISEGLSQADEAERKLEQANEQAQEELKAARSRASEIIEAANKRSNNMVEEAKEQARAEGDKIIASAQSEIDQQVVAARETLRQQVSSIALASASKVLGKEVDQSAHNQLIDEFAEKL